MPKRREANMVGLQYVIFSPSFLNPPPNTAIRLSVLTSTTWIIDSKQVITSNPSVLSSSPFSSFFSHLAYLNSHLAFLKSISVLEKGKERMAAWADAVEIIGSGGSEGGRSMYLST